jgi:hypothetical protein
MKERRINMFALFKNTKENEMWVNHNFIIRLLFLAVLIPAVMITNSNSSWADECASCSVRSDSLIGGGGIEYFVQQQEEDVSPFNAELRVGGLYDSRVGSSSGSDDEDDDTAITARLNAGWQGAITQNAGIRIDYRGYADFHQDYDQYDVIDQSISVEPLYKAGSFILSLPVSFNIGFEDGDHDYNRYVVTPTVTYLIPNTRQALALYGIGAKIDDEDDDKWLDEDGKTFGGGLAYLYFFENKSHIRLSVDYQHTTYDALVWQYGTSMSTDERDSDALVAGLDILVLFSKHFGAFMNYTFIHSDSNVDLYEYDRHLVEGGLALKF